MDEKNEDWCEIQPNIWKPSKEGEAIQGILIGKESEKGSFGSQAYMLETKAGEQALVWGSAVLDERMKYVKVGEQVKIEFKGTEKNKKGQDVKIFKVFKHQKARKKQENS